MSPYELQIVIGALASAVSGRPVLVEIDGERRLLDFVEATTDRRMVLHVMPRDGNGDES